MKALSRMYENGFIENNNGELLGWYDRENKILHCNSADNVTGFTVLVVDDEHAMDIIAEAHHNDVDEN